MFGLGLLALASFLGLISLGHVESGLERLAGDPETMAALMERDTGRGEALFIVLGFLLLTPIVVIVAVGLPMFLVAVAATSLNLATGVPFGWSRFVIWSVFVVVAALTVGAWLPWAESVSQLVARAFLVALAHGRGGDPPAPH